MTTPVEKGNSNKFCEFHGEVGHNTDECMHLKRQIEELIKNGKLSHVIKELKQGSGKDQPKTTKKGETSGKDKPLAILMALSGSEKPNDPSYRTPHWLQWRNHMANGTNTTASKNKRCRAFHLYMDELCGRILTFWSSRIISLECIMVSGPKARPSNIIQAVEERIKVAIHPEHPEQTIAIGSTLTEEGRKALCDLLRCNLDVFSWKPADMTGVPRHIAEHKLNVREGCSPVRQKKRSQAPKRNKAIQEEVEKLVDIGILKEVHYHSWLSNPVMVKKHDDIWRMCVDFKDLNKACPKDGYPLPEIDWKVESLCGYPFKCFLDAYKGYHQIKMAKVDEEKTTFITSQGVFCYSKMPFGLKNAGATYQHLVDKAFQKQIGRNLEVYVDDLVIKSRTEHEIIRDMKETFKTLREINMKLNPKKCTFRIEEGTFLGYKVNTEGIMSKQIPFQISRKIIAVLQNFKEMHKKSDFQWTAEAEAAFKEMKKLIAKLPTLTAPMEKEELIVYLVAAREAINAFLMTEREAKQMRVYFVSRTLQGPEINYTSMEKLVLALVHASKRLKRYFQASSTIN
ncbi:reverse transcriptase domain-containing protein [Tanacetum coccineum]